MKKTNEEFVEEIVNRTFEALEEYMGSSVKILFRCDVCDHEWPARPNSILTGSGCPECSRGYSRLKSNEILKDFGDGSILIDISTKKHKSKTSRMDLSDFVRIEGRIGFNRDGYPVTTVNGKCKSVHQVIMNNPPEGKQVDHTNRDRCDNRVCNLRYLTHRENMQNRSDNTSGVPGVHWYTRHNKWQANIQINGIRKHLGYFDNLEDAAEAKHYADAVLESVGTVEALLLDLMMPVRQLKPS